MRQDRLEKAAIPIHRRSNNTSAPPETMMVEEKIVGPGGTTPIDPLMMVAMGRRKTGMKKAIIQSPANLKKGHSLRNSVSGASNKSLAT